MIGKLDGYAEPFPGFARGKAAHTARNLGFRVEHQHVSATMRERRKAIVMQGAYVGSGATLNSVIMDKISIIKPDKSLCGTDTFPVYVGKGIVV